MSTPRLVAALFCIPLILLSLQASWAADAPSWSITIPPAGEPGEPMILSGVIYAADGSTPVEGVLLRVYHTDARGYYNEQGATGGAGGANARLRGTMRTDAQGRYEFRTIRPASYPDTKIQAHVHASVQAPGGTERVIDEYHFAGDPHLSAGRASAEQARGRFSAVVTLTKGSDGIWRGSRDIVMPGR